MRLHLVCSCCPSTTPFFAPQSPDADALQTPASVPLNNCQYTSCATPCLGSCVARLSLAVYGRIIPTSYVPCYRFVLDRYLACSILVAYISPFAWPQPGIGIESLFPPFCFSRPLRTRKLNTDCIATSYLAFPSRTHTHSLSSLSLSLSQR